MYIFFHKLIKHLSSVIIVALFTLCLWQLAAAGWIQGKAIIAQQLLNHSWHRTLRAPEISHAKVEAPSSDGSIIDKPAKMPVYKPWPWADTWPAAKLAVPRFNIEQIVLAGDSGSSLAFGPGYSLAAATPNTTGTTVISAHRDTHFRFLADMKLNDLIYLQTPEKTQHYRVYDIKIVDSRTYHLPTYQEQTLLLVTCYPFNAISPGGKLRYLVFAHITAI